MSQEVEAMELAVVVKGEIVTSNFDSFAEIVRKQLLGINKSLKTDEDFGRAEQDSKAIKVARKQLAEKRSEVLEQLDGINSLVNGISSLDRDMLDVQGTLDKALKIQKEAVKKQILEDGLAAIDTEGRSIYRSAIETVIKGKRNLASMQAAVDQQVSIFNKRIQDNRKMIDAAIEKSGEEIAPDMVSLENMVSESLGIELQRRVEKLEAQAEKKRLAEEKAQAERKLEEAEKKAEEPQKEEPLPEPKKVDSLPVKNTPETPAPTPDDVDARVEMTAFKKEGLRVFEALKKAKGSLKCEVNVEKVDAFAKLVNRAWKETL